MADIEVVIKIPEEIYKQIIEFGFLENTHGKICYKAIKNGMPLPKGHGRLVDEKDLSLMTVHLIDGILVCDAQTIIEADKRSEDKDAT